jgi:hypothetical protein
MTWGGSMHDRTRIDACVEQLCQKGCARVWGDIELLERGGRPVGTEALSAEDCGLVLQELKAVMSVYADRCRLDD